LNNAKKGIKKRRKNGILVKKIFGGTWSTRSYAKNGTQSTWSYAAGTRSTASTLAMSGLHGWYSVYNGKLLAGTKSTDSTKGYGGLWIKKLFGTKSTANV